MLPVIKNLQWDRRHLTTRLAECSERKKSIQEPLFIGQDREYRFLQPIPIIVLERWAHMLRA